MAKREIERAVTGSVLDRLIDLDRGVADVPVSFAESLQRFKMSVQRDLEWLLNTRQIPEPAPAEFEEVGRSLYHFGLPDLSSVDSDSADARDELLRSAEAAIALFEPRLEHPRITMVESEGDDFRRELRFHLEGTLRMDPTPEHVVFDSVLHVASGQYDIGGARGA